MSLKLTDHATKLTSGSETMTVVPIDVAFQAVDETRQKLSHAVLILANELARREMFALFCMRHLALAGLKSGDGVALFQDAATEHGKLPPVAGAFSKAVVAAPEISPGVQKSLLAITQVVTDKLQETFDYVGKLAEKAAASGTAPAEANEVIAALSSASAVTVKSKEGKNLGEWIVTGAVTKSNAYGNALQVQIELQTEAHFDMGAGKALLDKPAPVYVPKAGYTAKEWEATLKKATDTIKAQMAKDQAVVTGSSGLPNWKPKIVGGKVVIDGFEGFDIDSAEVDE